MIESGMVVSTTMLDSIKEVNFAKIRREGLAC